MRRRQAGVSFGTSAILGAGLVGRPWSVALTLVEACNLPFEEIDLAVCFDDDGLETLVEDGVALLG